MGKTAKREVVYLRGEVYWHRNPTTGRRESTKLRDKKAAIAYHAQCERRAADPSYAAQDQATLGAWRDEVIRSKSARRSAGTVSMYRIKAGHLLRIFGDCSLSEITPKAVDRYVTQRLEEGAKQSTIYRETVVLTQILKAARRSGEFRADPKSLLPTDWSNNYTPRSRNLKPEEVAALINACAFEEHAAWIAFVVASGARHAEAQRNEPSDLDPAEMLVTIHGTKTVGSKRTVPVLDTFRPLWDLVFDFWARHGRGPRWDRSAKGVAQVAARAGLEHLSPNDLRRTHASWLIQSGVEQGLVSRLLGHRDGTMVARVYGQVTPKQLSGLVRRQIESGTNTAQSGPGDAASAEKQPDSAPALWRNGRRGGLKILPGTAHSLDLAGKPPLVAARNRQTPVSAGTNGTQSRRRPDALDLAFEALRLGVLPTRRAS
jgi:integrase